MDRESVIERVRKLLAKANDASVTEEEAAAFAGKANELLLKHKLEMSDLELQAEDVVDPMDADWIDVSAALGYSSKGKQSWLTLLIDGIAKANFCVPLHDPNKTKKVFLVGRTSDKAIAVYLIETLARNGRNLAFANWPTGSGRRAETMRARSSFLLGYVEKIRARLAEMRKDVEQKGGQYAVVRFNNAMEDAAQAARQWNGGRMKFNPGEIRDSRAFQLGAEAGSRVSLQGGISGGTAQRGTLARGQMLLGA